MRTVLAAAVITGLALTACGEPEPGGGAPSPPSEVPMPTTDVPVPVASVVPPTIGGIDAVPPAVLESGLGTTEPVADLLGSPLAEFEAVAAGRGLGPVRITWRDGEHLAVTDDLETGRVNVAVMDHDGVDVVVDARVETDPETGLSEPEATVVGVYEGVEFYPACGDEQLEQDDVTWFQVQEFEYPEIYDRAVNGYREQAPESVAVRGFARRVVAPGPGDDVGTLVVWSDGVAYFVSDSGSLDAWLVQEELTYDWVC